MMMMSIGLTGGGYGERCFLESERERERDDCDGYATDCVHAMALLLNADSSWRGNGGRWL